MLLSSEAKQKTSSECWPRAQELSPVTSSNATFHAVVSTSGVWGGPAVTMQQQECNQGAPGLALSVSGDGVRPFRGRVQFGETRKDKYPNSPKPTNFSSTNRTVPGIQWSGINRCIYRRESPSLHKSLPQLSPCPNPMDSGGALPGYSHPLYATLAPQSSPALSSSLASEAPGGARHRR